MRLVVATGNPGKASEFGRLLGRDFQVEALPAELELPAETGDTFAANALIKARSIFAALACETAVLADDSGLSVYALGGRPGVWSARYAGEGAGDEANNRKLLDDLRGVSDRKARFVCALALLLPGSRGPLGSPAGRLLVAEGVLEGSILEAPRGNGGFGYDPVFRPEGWDKSLGEASPGEKDTVSHRARAVEALRGVMENQGGRP